MGAAESTEENPLSLEPQPSEAKQPTGHHSGAVIEEKQAVPAKQVTAVVIGGGQRGNTYSRYTSERPEAFKVVGIAEPRDTKRRIFAEKYNVPKENVFSDWRELQQQPRLADVAVICTPDQLHVAPAIAMAELGYHILLEKPMAVTEADCEAITQVCKAKGVMLSVCHVLRYTPTNRKVKELIDSGVLGEILNIQHTEPVGFFHFAHSFVRGNWRNEATSTFSLMAKSCHDIDLLNYWMSSPCVSVSSFGALTHFRKSKKPQGAGDALRCNDCAVESACPYSAKRIYLRTVKMGHTGWPVSVLVEDTPDIENITEALAKGPYGRCVYECDNDVVDHQVVNMQFASGATASFTMVAMTEKICQRQTKVYGSKGELTVVDGEVIHHYDFLSDDTNVIHPPTPMHSYMTGHGGADFYLMDAFVKAVATQNPSLITTGADESLASHRLVFRAEEARTKHCVVDIKQLEGQQVVIERYPPSPVKPAPSPSL